MAISDFEKTNPILRACGREIETPEPEILDSRLRGNDSGARNSTWGMNYPGASGRGIPLRKIPLYIAASGGEYYPKRFN